MARNLSHLQHPLGVLLSVSSHLAIVRALQHSREGMSGRAVAREANMNHQACAVALRKLEALGVVERQGAGRTQLVRLNFDSYLVKELVLPILRKEAELLGVMRRDIADQFRHDAIAIVLFGSVARGDDMPGSDLDILLVVRPATRNTILQKVQRYSDDFRRKYGVPISTIVLTAREVRQRLKESDALLKNILADGVNLLPTTLSEAIA